MYCFLSTTLHYWCLGSNIVSRECKSKIPISTINVCTNRHILNTTSWRVRKFCDVFENRVVFTFYSVFWVSFVRLKTIHTYTLCYKIYIQTNLIKLLNQGFLKNLLILSFKKFFRRYQQLVEKYSTNCVQMTKCSIGNFVLLCFSNVACDGLIYNIWLT